MSLNYIKRESSIYVKMLYFSKAVEYLHECTFMQ